MKLRNLPKYALMALIGLSCTTLSACNKDNRTEVVFWHTMGQSNQEKLNAMIEQFEKDNPDIKITHAAQGGYTDIESKISKAIPAKTTPTMAFCYPDHVAGYVDANVSVKLNDLISDPEIGLSAEDLQDYKDAGFWDEGASYDSVGSIYSVPFSKSTEVLFMNTTWMQKHKLTVDGTETGAPIVPTKWENEENPDDLYAMFNLCRKIKSIDDSITPLGYDSDDNMYITLSAQYGIPYTSINEEGKGSIDFNNDQAKGLITRLKGYYDEGLFVTKGTLPNSTYTSTKFKAEELIMSIGSTGGTSYNIPSQDPETKEYQFNAEVFRIPQANEEAPKVISQGPSITFFKNSKITDEQVKASWKFYKHITNAYNSAVYAILTGYEPVRESAYQSDEYQAHLAATGEAETLYTKVANLTATDAIKDAYFFSPVFVGSSTARQQAGGIITQVLLDKKTIDQAFDEAESETLFATA